MTIPVVLGAALGLTGRTNAQRATRALLGAGAGYGVSRYLDARRRRKLDDVRKQLRAVDSSMIQGAVGRPEGGYIRFNTGKLYHYKGMPASEIDALVRAESAGKYFNQHLRNKYRDYREV